VVDNQLPACLRTPGYISQEALRLGPCSRCYQGLRPTLTHPAHWMLCPRHRQHGVHTNSREAHTKEPHHSVAHIHRAGFTFTVLSERSTGRQAHPQLLPALPNPSHNSAPMPLIRVGAK
jgi:hypothetical protein